MKPRDGKELRKQRSATAALKREIKNRFGWLDGAPALRPGEAIDLKSGISWVRFRKAGAIHPHTVTITEADLRLALRSHGELRVQFPRAFPNLVGNTESWADQRLVVPKLLRESKVMPIALGKSSPLPLTNSVRHRAGQILEDHPNLKSIVSSLVWRTAHDEKLVLADLRKLRKFAATLDTILPTLRGLCESEAEILETQIWLLRLAELAPVEVLQPFLELISHPGLSNSIWAMADLRLDDAASKVLNSYLPPRLRCGENIKSEAFHFLDVAIQLAKEDKPRVRRYLKLFHLTYPHALLNKTAKWWKLWYDSQSDFKLLHEFPERVHKKHLQKIARRCNTLRDTQVKIPDISRIHFLILTTIGSANFNLLAGLLEHIPTTMDNQASSFKLLEHWHRNEAKPLVLRELEKFFRLYPPTNLKDLGPWATVFSREHWNVPESVGNLLDSAELLRVFFDAVHLLISRPSKTITTETSDGLAPIVKVTKNAQLAAEIYLAFEAAEAKDLIDDWAEKETVLIAALEQDTDPAAAPQTYSSFYKFTYRLYDDELAMGLTLLRKFHTANELDLQRKLLAESACKTLNHLLQLATAVKGPIPDLPSPLKFRSSWMQRYPKEFAELLSALRSFLPDVEAKARASAVLGKDFPDPDALQKELDHMQASLAKSPSERLAKRAEKIRGWIKNPRTPSPTRIANLKKKLSNSVSQARFDKWKKQIHEKATAGIGKLFPKLRDLDEWLECPKRTIHLLGVANLDKDEIKHPIWVLQHFDRYDFRDEPANRRFIKTQQAKGLDMTPWLNETGVYNYKHENGPPMELALEDDPYEILDMGQHFDTCLSPDGCNYYSVYSNISDINKRVVYERKNGKVHSRCLLAISDEGTILVFHPYSHESGEVFKKAITAFADDLAERMGTIVTPDGEVSNLVCPDWYDDGSIDVGRRFDFLRENSDFRKELDTIEKSQFRERLFEEINVLDALTLPYVLELPELRAQPQLATEIFPEVRQQEAFLSPKTLLLAAELGMETEEEQYSLSLLRRYAPGHLIKEGWPYYSNRWQIVWLLAQREPSIALKILQKIRPTKVRSWTQVTDPWRLLPVAEAYFQLHRKGPAKRIFQRLTDSELGKGYFNDRVQDGWVDRRLAELE